MRKVDWELLADHLGGALAGTPEEQRVADLIATDSEWSRAASCLSDALDAVARDLRALPDPVLPDDVTVRLDRALREGRTDRADSEHLVDRAPVQRRSSAQPATRPPGSPAGGARPGGRPAGRGRRRVLRWGSGLAGAAGVVAFALFGIANLNLLTGPDDSDLMAVGDGETGSVPHSAEELPGEPGLAHGGPHLQATGTHYQRSDFTDQTVGPFGLGPDGPAIEPDPADDAGSRPPGEEEPLRGRLPAVPDELQLLWPLPDACVAAVEQAYAPTQVTLVLADFAHFDGEPAVVIWITTIDGNRWVSVVGPDCGRSGAGVDERYRAQIG